MRLIHGQIGMVLPAGWRDVTLITLIEPSISGMAHSITISQEPDPDGLSLMDYARRQLAQLAQELPEFELLQCIGMDLPCAGAVRLQSRWRGPEQKLLRQLQHILPGPGGFLIVTGTAPGETMDQFIAVFDQVVRSIHSTTAV